MFQGSSCIIILWMHSFVLGFFWCRKWKDQWISTILVHTALTGNSAAFSITSVHRKITLTDKEVDCMVLRWELLSVKHTFYLLSFRMLTSINDVFRSCTAQVLCWKKDLWTCNVCFLIGSKLFHPFDHPLITAFLSLHNVHLVLFCWSSYHVLEPFLLSRECVYCALERGLELWCCSMQRELMRNQKKKISFSNAYYYNTKFLKTTHNPLLAPLEPKTWSNFHHALS